MAGLIDFLGGQGGIVTNGLGNMPGSLQLAPSPSPGAEQQEAVDIITTNFNPTFAGLNWSSIIDAIAVGDATNFANAQYSFDQLFLSTASSPYLVTLASDYGIEYPTNVGMPDSLFSKYAISTYVDQLTLNALEEIQEVFYGDVATRANMVSANPEPYTIYGGYSLNLLIDGIQNIPVNFQTSDFISNGAVLAEEVAFAITRACLVNNSNAFAVSEYNPLTNKNYVRIFSGALGFAGSIQVIGGQAEDYLLFPSQLTNTSNNLGALNIDWTITASTLVGGNARYTFEDEIGGPQDPQIWNAGVGDYVNIFAPIGFTSLFNPNNLGSFKITAVGVDYFEVVNPRVVPQSVQDSTGNPTYVNFYRPYKYTIQTNYRWAAVSQNGTSESLDITFPATSNAVLRTPPFAAYLQNPTQFSILSLVRDFNGLIEVTTSIPNNLTIGNQVFLDNVIPTAFAQQKAVSDPNNFYASELIFNPNLVTLLDGRSLTFGGAASEGTLCSNLAQVIWPQNRGIQNTLAPNNLLSFNVQSAGNVIINLSNPSSNASLKYLINNTPNTVLHVNGTDLNSSTANIGPAWNKNGTVVYNPLTAPIPSVGPFTTGSDTVLLGDYTLPIDNPINFPAGKSWSQTVIWTVTDLGPDGPVLINNTSSFDFYGYWVYYGAPGVVFGLYNPSAVGIQTSIGEAGVSSTLVYGGLSSVWTVPNNSSGLFTVTPGQVVIITFGYNDITQTMFLKVNNNSTVTGSLGTPNIQSTISGATIGDYHSFDSNGQEPLNGLIYEVWASTDTPSSGFFTTIYNNYIANLNALPAVWNSIPVPGDTINIPSTSILAGPGLVNQGWYKVTAATSTSITMTPLYTVGAITSVTNTAIGITDNIDCYIANDPVGNVTWTTMTALPSPWINSNAYQNVLSLLSNGKVLVAGGQTGTTTYNTTLSAAALYNPANDTWTATGSMNSARIAKMSTTLNDGTVMVYGGANGTDTTCELYDPASGYWVKGPTLTGSNLPVSGAVLTALPTHPVLAVLSGGLTSGAVYLSSLYFFGYIAGNLSWFTKTLGTGALVKMNFPRSGHTATAFLDSAISATVPVDAVLIFGGYTTGTVSEDTAEILPAVGIPYLVPTPTGYTSFVGDSAIVLNNGNIFISSFGSNTNSQLMFNSNIKTFTTERPSIGFRRNAAASILLDGSILIIGGNLSSVYFGENYSKNVSGGGLNNMFTVQSIQSPYQFTISTPTKAFRTSANTGVVTWNGSGFFANAPGPYIYDTAVPFTTNNNDSLLNAKFVNSSVPISSIFTTLSQQLNQGSNYNVINVANATAFPNAPGYLVFNFGNDSQVIYVPYLSRPTSNTLQLDYKFVFPTTVPIGADVTLSISSIINSPATRGPWIPPNVVDLNTFYLTDSPAGRAAAQAAIAAAAAGGVLLNNIVVYPGSFGLGNGQQPVIGVPKINDIVGIYAENVDQEIVLAREGE